MAPEHSAGMLSSVPKCNGVVMCLTERTGILDKLCSGISDSAAAHELDVNQQNTLKKVSLNRNTHKTRIHQ